MILVRCILLQWLFRLSSIQIADLRLLRLMGRRMLILKQNQARLKLNLIYGLMIPYLMHRFKPIRVLIFPAREIQVLVHDVRLPGVYTVRSDDQKSGSGIYFNVLLRNHSPKQKSLS
jgi:hypothetical protein